MVGFLVCLLRCFVRFGSVRLVDGAVGQVGEELAGELSKRELRR